VRVARRRSHSEDEDCSNRRRTIGNASRRWKSRLCATRWTRTWYCALYSSVAMCGRSIERTYYATSKKYPTRCPDVLSSAWTTSQTRRESKIRHVARTTASTALCKPCKRATENTLLHASKNARRKIPITLQSAQLNPTSFSIPSPTISTMQTPYTFQSRTPHPD
jgi:hypothetical protein